ncbi:TonB-dependent receptor domain-containing protein [Algivirga pacifica]|uniref:TonB-dependent receptor n=1 Tax=Algivirga pacifica TaxID=1162670 RepID=A0ABP9D592_9BACT
MFIRLHAFFLLLGAMALGSVLHAQTKDVSDSLQLNYHIRQNDIDSYAVTNIVDKKAISLLGGNLTGLLKRNAGISFSNGALISVRGLNPRYTNVMLNGLFAPVTEQNIKAFSLGLVPGAAVQAFEVYKSGDYHNPGEWGGAVVDILSDAALSENFTQLAFGVGYQHNFTFQDFIKDEEHGSELVDFFGYGINRRDFQNDIVGREELQAMSRNEAAAEGAKLQNTWALETTTAIPNLNFGFGMGRVILKEGEMQLSTINSLSFSRVQGGIHFNRARYDGYVFDQRGNVISSTLRNYSTDAVFSIKADLALNSTWNWKIDEANTLTFGAIYSHSGENKTISRYFVNLQNNGEAYFAQYGPLEKELLLFRLSGQHEWTDFTEVSWSLGFNNSTREDADLRRVAAQSSFSIEDTPFLLIIPETSKSDIGARFGSDMLDQSYAGRVDITQQTQQDWLQFRFGGMMDYYQRDFKARVITNVKDNLTSTDLLQVLASDLPNIYQSANFGPEGYYIVDGTTPFDEYDASNLLVAVYTGGEVLFSDNWRSSLGFRYEYFNQKLNSGDVVVDNHTDSFLPYVNVNYVPSNHRMAVKFSYSRSVNRPAFRELAPFIFFDFDYRSDVQGTVDLKDAKLHNFDLAFLYEFGNNEYVSLNPFYKQIKDPIEMIYVVRSDVPLFTFQNAEQAEVSGIELEFSKFLSNNQNSLLSHLLLSANLAYIASNIDLGDDTNEVLSNRPLQGQTPWIASAGLTFFTEDKKGVFTVGYNFLGSALFTVADGVETFPRYTEPQHFLSATMAYKIGKHWGMNLGVGNILNTVFNQVADVNLNAEIDDEVDNVVQEGLRYQNFSMNVSYKF